MMTFEFYQKKFTLMPIRNCPGRFIITGISKTTSISDLVENDLKSQIFSVPVARDRVVVTPFSDGSGLISYMRENGTWLHTLNSSEGFSRKLSQLGISLNASSS